MNLNGFVFSYSLVEALPGRGTPGLSIEQPVSFLVEALPRPGAPGLSVERLAVFHVEVLRLPVAVLLPAVPLLTA